MTTCYVAFGSNLGDRHAFVDSAVKQLEKCQGVLVTQISSHFETVPVGGPIQRDFINAVTELDTTLDVQALWVLMKQIELRAGRERDVRNGPRTLDLDLLFYGDQKIMTDDLMIPHPRLHERAFVLEPMMELNPNFVHPVFNLTIQQLWEAYLEKDDQPGIAYEVG